MTTATANPHPICYSRVSREEAVKFGQSLQAQADRLIVAHPNGRLLADEGVSAGTPLAKRPAGALILQSVEDGTCKLVVCVRSDRLFRNAGEALTTVQYWATKGVGLLVLDSPQGRINTLDPGGWFAFSILCAAAEYERNLTRQRTRETMAHLKDKTWVSKRGKKEVTGFGCPLRHAPETVALVLALATDGLDPEDIVDRMSEPGMPVPPRGGPWTVNTVRGILRRGAR